jgi:ParB/RepB/Spo0J family partition protein
MEHMSKNDKQTSETEQQLTFETLKLEGSPMAKPNESVEISKVAISKIKLSRNSRMDVTHEELEGLMQSIKEVGLLQPIGLIRREKGYFDIAYGNRRYLACSKLGLSTIPAIIRDEKREFDIDIQNLTENIQRRNLGLAEIGRYVGLLKKQGLTPREAAVRLGVPAKYVADCITAFERVPEKYRDDIEVRLTPEQKNQRGKAGKISVRAANAIESARKSYRLDAKDAELLYQAAKSDERFKPENVKAYAGAIKQGKKPLDEVPITRVVRLDFFLTQDEYNRLDKKHISNGPFSSMNSLFKAILKGEKSERVKIIERKKDS